MRNVLMTLLCFVCIMSCKNKEENVFSKSKSQNEAISVIDTLQLRLNDGNKWIANPETHEGVANMETIIKAFKKENKKDYQVLGDSLAKQTGYIIKNCSMKGEPHDQLHVVLVPMLDEISILREQKNTSESKTALNRLEHLISTYFIHFKV